MHGSIRRVPFVVERGRVVEKLSRYDLPYLAFRYTEDRVRVVARRLLRRWIIIVE